MKIQSLFWVLALGAFSAAPAWSAAAPGAEAQNPDDTLDVIIRSDNKPSPPKTKIIQDNYEKVIGKLKSKIEIPSCYVQDVIYGEADPEYVTACEKRDEGKYPVAALYFSKALDNMQATQPWASEYCNYGIGNALYEGRHFNGYIGKHRTYQPPSVYFRNVLSANPKSRFMPDIVVKLPICLIEQGKLDEAEAELRNAEDAIKKYKAATSQIDAGFQAIADKAAAQIAVADAHLAERKAVASNKWSDAVDKWQAARSRSQKYPDILTESVDGYLRALVKKGEFTGVNAEVDTIVEKYKTEGEKILPLMPGAFLAKGHAFLGQAMEYEKKGQKVQAYDSYFDARWAFLHVVAKYFDNDDYVAAAHYYSGICCEKRKDLESDAIEKAAQHWTLILLDFPKNEYAPLAEKELTRLGIPLPPKPEEPKAAAPAAPGTPPAAKAPAAAAPKAAAPKAPAPAPKPADKPKPK